MEYMVVRVETDMFGCSELEEQVNEAIKKGWKPQGGISICEATYISTKRVIWAQAMIKEEI